MSCEEVSTMPIYEYSCENCQSTFELLVRDSDRPACPDCGSRKLEKLLSVPAAHRSGEASLPVCDGPQPGPCGMGGCGLPECEF
jgi:putative FmdB family regulatory protein